jgi:hypothetical protein
MTKEIKTEIQINSNPAKIWKLLMEFEKYPEWNPFIKSIKGQALEGTKIIVKMEPPEAKGMTFKPKILRINPEKEFRWLGHLLIKGLFDGEHIFELIDKQDGSTTFIQREIFKGILIPLFKKMLDNNTRKGFELMNQQLKVESEKQ